jgi:hypothetical protein
VDCAADHCADVSKMVATNKGFGMSSYQYFDILPFDPLLDTAPQITLPFDRDDLVRQLQAKCPNSEIRVSSTDGGLAAIYLYISHEVYGPWVVAQFTEPYDTFHVSLWPKRLAKELIRWYRSYIPLSYPLFILYPDTGYVAELPANVSLEELENMYPFPVEDE